MFGGEQLVPNPSRDAGQAPAADRAEAQRFLEYLGGAPNVVFQFRTLSRNGGTPQKRRGTFAECFDYLAARNAAKCDVYVTVNETDGGTCGENVTAVRAVFVDFDEILDCGRLALRQQRMDYFSATAPVSLITETSPRKFHCYWFTNGMDLEWFTPCQKALAAILGGDPNVHDLPRIMRVPGFVHWKGAPFLSRIIYIAGSKGRRRQADYVPLDTLDLAITKVRKKFGPWDAPRKPQPAPAPDLFDVATAEERRYALAALANGADNVENAPEGTRNTTLNKEAFNLARFVETGALTREEIEGGLEQAAQEAGLDALEIPCTIKSGINGRSRKPHAQKTGNGHAAATSTGEPAVITAAALEDKRFPPIKYIVKGYLVEGLTILAGRPKIGKSWLVLDWALAVADGGLVFDNVRCKQGDVLYLALEDNERRLQSRIGIVLGRDDSWPERFHYATEWPRAHEGGLGYIRKWIKEHSDARLIVVDVLQRFRKPVQSRENVYAADYDAVKGLQAVASETGVAVLIVMHLRKSAADLDPVDTISGSLGAAGGADSFLIINGKSPDFTFYGRGRDIVEMDLAISFNSETCRWAVIGNRSQVKVTAERTKILKALCYPPFHLLPVRIAEMADMPRGNVRRLLMKMLAEDQVLRAETGHYVHPNYPDVVETLNKSGKNSSHV